MKKFEYNIITKSGWKHLELEDLLDLGEGGWELCTDHINYSKHTYIFKREVE